MMRNINLTEKESKELFIAALKYSESTICGDDVGVCDYEDAYEVFKLLKHEFILAKKFHNKFYIIVNYTNFTVVDVNNKVINIKYLDNFSDFDLLVFNTELDAKQYIKDNPPPKCPDFTIHKRDLVIKKFNKNAPL